MDSSDYSNLAAAVGDGPFAARQRWLDLRTRILAAKANGRAVFRFSYPIVMEAYPTSPDHLAHAVGRAAVIGEVCGKDCILDFLTLVTEESKALVLRGEQFERAAAWRNDGAWHPNPDGLLSESIAGFRTGLPSQLREQLKESRLLNRKARRKLELSMFSRDGTPTRQMASLFTLEQRQELSAAIGQRFHLPGSALTTDIPAKVILGELPISAMSALLGAILRDLPTLFQQEAVRKHEGALFHWIRSTGQSVSAPLREARANLLDMIGRLGLDRVRSLHAQSELESISQTWLVKLRTQLLEALWKAEHLALTSSGVTARDWDGIVKGSGSGRMPALDALVTACVLHIVAALRPSAQPRQPRDSDGGDMIHMMYLPYVDVFRCDGYAATIADQVVSEFGLSAEIVTSMEQALEVVGC